MKTKFQELVYKQVKKIPRGQTRSYKDIALKLKSSPRAIGQALSRNIDKQVPCHRVIMSSGKIGGYHGSSNNKEKIRKLKSEKAI